MRGTVWAKDSGVGRHVGVGASVGREVGIGPGQRVGAKVEAIVRLGVGMEVGEEIGEDMGVLAGVGIAVAVGPGPAQAARSSNVIEATATAQPRDVRMRGLYQSEAQSTVAFPDGKLSCCRSDTKSEGGSIHGG